LPRGKAGWGKELVIRSTCSLLKLQVTLELIGNGGVEVEDVGPKQS